MSTHTIDYTDIRVDAEYFHAICALEGIQKTKFELAFQLLASELSELISISSK